VGSRLGKRQKGRVAKSGQGKARGGEMMAIKLALEATIITMLFLGILALLINRIKQKNICPVCGDPRQGKFCCEAHELLH